jgi:hypothetical protein
MDRNIITASDVLRSQRSGSRGYAEASGDEVQLTADDYWGRLTKYLPVEVIGGYLILQGLLQTAYPEGTTGRIVALGILFLLGGIGTWVVARQVLLVHRRRQIAVSLIGYLTWVFATGGCFAELDWYGPWMGTAAVVIFAVAVKVVRLPALNEISR